MAFRRQVKNFVKNYSDAEIKVREATSNDPWGPSSSLMLGISDLTFNTIYLSEIMSILWQRLNDHGKNWRHVYKSLMLMDYLIKNGSKKVIQHCREGFCNLQTLKDFQHIDEAGKDQGYHIRQKSKQVITLLMDEQLLHKEREAAHRTRQRTSCSATRPQALPGAGHSPAARASAHTPGTAASGRSCELLKVARLHHKKNASKAGLKQEQCGDIPLPSGNVSSQETPPLKANAWKSTEDLMLFYEDPKLLLPTTPPPIISSATWLSGGQADVCNLCDADAVPVPSEKSSSLQTNLSLAEEGDRSITNTATEKPLQVPLEEQSAASSFETLTTLMALWPSSEKEFISPDLSLSKSDSTFCNLPSVETLYVSPSFKTFDSVEKLTISQDPQKPTQSSIFQMEDKNLKASTTWVSNASGGTSSFSTLSVSSSDSASPEKSVPLLSPVLAGPSFRTLSHQQSFSTSFKEKDKTARVTHPFTPEGPVSSVEEENDNLNLLEILPDNSDSAKNKISDVLRSNWVTYCTENINHFTSVSCPSFQTTRGPPRETEANNSIEVLLGEVKNAIVKLHEDLSMVIQELNVISGHLVSMSGQSPQSSTSVQVPQASEESSEHI
ncbi:ENTH domain-containing protein 1 [Manis pentadactyla]|uniref:ENTH domain-containing protein 1 n=1 Tax=Manis pentadactyla TaxID=143292 RepID=UPI00255CE366|nr:ENTH domain-containing protein 1 [Manis pentadactyla]